MGDEVSPEQLAALGLELLDLLAQLVLAAFEIFRKTRQASPEAALRVGLENLLVQPALVLRQQTPAEANISFVAPRNRELARTRCNRLVFRVILVLNSDGRQRARALARARRNLNPAGRTASIMPYSATVLRSSKGEQEDDSDEEKP